MIVDDPGSLAVAAEQAALNQIIAQTRATHFLFGASWQQSSDLEAPFRAFATRRR
jgi:hypothetical protein